MEDKLRLNHELYGFDGIIGRRDFFLNYIYISSVALVFNMPFLNRLFLNMSTLEDYFNISQIFAESPILLKLWVILGTAWVCVLFMSNIFRRLNDICGGIKLPVQIFFAILYVMFNFWMFLPFGVWMLVSTIFGILCWMLILKKGKITSNYPQDFRKDFNWGAFFGTWIWGLFNKSYIPLWQIILGFTPWSFNFALVCGLKGNEWAFNNKKCNDVERFQRSQKKQSIIIAILAFFIVPILCVVISGAITGFMVMNSVNTMKKDPQQIEQTLEKIGDVMQDMASLYFVKNEILENENKFYVKESEWNVYSYTEKKDIFDLAASVSADVRRRKHDASNSTEFKSFSRRSELKRTKIYDSESNNLLGEYVFDEFESSNNVKTGDLVKAAMKAYRFYK